MSVFLEVRDVRKRFGSVEALCGVSLELDRDELLAVLGPTGAGKTTLLRVLAGLEAPDSGTVRMDGQGLLGMPPAARDIALVFQNFSLYPDWTVRRNLEFPLRAPGRRETARDIAERVRWAADLLQVGHLLDRPAARLSGGEMQRVAIGRAIVRRPKLFLFDEPLSNLDAKLRESLRVELAELRRRLRVPMVYVTHDQAEALSMGDRVAVLGQGAILQTGSPEEVYRHPVSPEVAAQVGQPPINVVEVESRAGWWTTAEGTRVASGAPAEGEKARAGVRPEDWSLTGGETAGRVRVVEHLGAVKVVLAAWAGTRIRILVPADTAVAPGDEVRPRVSPGKAVLWKAS
jgi:multiple sugar transport system ATP-binding protein